MSLIEPVISHTPAGTSKFTVGQYLQEFKTSWSSFLVYYGAYKTVFRNLPRL